jgi:alcohol dehydrogenase (cytochrome c)/quinohemoprotein ethanol dehydrogenase
VENPAARYNVTGKPFLSTHNPNGAHTWHSMAFSPQTGLVYLPIHGSPFVFGQPKSFDPVKMATNVGSDFAGNAALDPKDVLAKTYGRLIAWDPVNQREVWRVERAGPANGGALATAGGLVFQGTGSGEFTALEDATGKQLWSVPTQTGVVAAPMSYAIDGEQYVAILVGTGSSWAMIGGDTNMKGFAPQNVSRLLVFKLGGQVQLPPAPAMQRPPIDPPPATAAAAVVARGAPIYETYCGSCHGAGVVGVGLLPDLRRTPFLHSPDGWQEVVIGGARKAHGMASFANVMSAEEAQAARAYVILRANQDKAAGGNVPAPTGDR